jgi:hypothetical protein
LSPFSSEISDSQRHSIPPSFLTSLPPPPSPPPPPLPPLPSNSSSRDPPAPRQPNPKSVSPTSSLRSAGEHEIDFGELGKNLNHPWRRASSTGRCPEIQIPKSVIPLSGRTRSSVPLRDAEQEWSTLGGDT